MSVSNEREGCIKFTFDLGAVMAAIIALVGGLLIGMFGFGQVGVRTTVVTTDNAQSGSSPAKIGLSSTPQPTYTLLPTYTPLPTQQPYTTIPTSKPNIIVASPLPYTVTATPSADQQNLVSGSIIVAGQGFTRRGVTITLRKPIYIESDNFTAYITIENNSNQQILVSWRNSFFHAKDDRGKQFPQMNQNAGNWDQIKQFSVASASKYEFGLQCCRCYDGVGNFDRFQGAIDPSARYLVFTLDQMAGLANMSWRYDLLP